MIIEQVLNAKSLLQEIETLKHKELIVKRLLRDGVPVDQKSFEKLVDLETQIFLELRGLSMKLKIEVNGW